MKKEIIFEELSTNGKKILLSAFDHSVDKDGFILNEKGNKIPSEEFPKEFIHIDNACFIPGSLKVIDGTPTAISKFIREWVEVDDRC